jgi:hypothetical protein
MMVYKRARHRHYGTVLMSRIADRGEVEDARGQERPPVTRPQQGCHVYHADLGDFRPSQ